MLLLLVVVAVELLYLPTLLTIPKERIYLQSSNCLSTMKIDYNVNHDARARTHLFVRAFVSIANHLIKYSVIILSWTERNSSNFLS